MIDREAIRGHLEMLILSVLEDQPAHGFEVLRRIEEKGCGLLRMKEGSVYPSLYRLEEAGCVKARWEDGSVKRRGPRRRIYQLTRSGRAKLARDREGWGLFVSAINSILEARA